MSARDHKVDPGKDCICLILIQESEYKENSGSISAVFLSVRSEEIERIRGKEKREEENVLGYILCQNYAILKQ